MENFWAGGSGVVVLPCGAGKTLVGAAAMATSSTTTLILVTNTVSARQWKDELLKRTSLTEEEIGEYSGSVKEVRPVTIATYQVLTTKRGGLYPHLELVDGNDWGLIIYDEVHLLPAPIFRMTADLQARRRLGLTATLVREDGREGEVFSLIGPKRYDAPWKDIEAQGYIAPADCVEVRMDLPRDERVAYAMAEDADKYRLCATSESKTLVVEQLVAGHAGEQLLVIGQYIDQLDEIGERLQRAGDQGRHLRSRNARGSLMPSAPARCRPWWCPRSPTSPSTCPRPRSRSRCPVPSVPGRRRPSAWAGCCAPRRTAAPPASTPSWPGTRWTRTSPPSASASWPSRATPTGSWMPRTSAPARPRTDPAHGLPARARH